jgi:uncharacterized protein YdeI (YjbR/CyaY-like superfamily)
MKMDANRFDKVEVTSAAEIRTWLEQHHTQENSVWLVTFKKVVADKYVSREEVLDELISFGWIDGVRSQVDETKTMQLISPRKTRPWARSYKIRAEKLIAEGKMHPAGYTEVEIAQNNGGWDEMNEVDDMVIPQDLEQALVLAGKAKEYFEEFPPSVKRNILRWIASAKKAETRQKRIHLTVSEASVNRRVASHS